MLISEFLHRLETVVPLEAAGYERDAIGLQAGLDAETELRAALFAYEVTSEVIVEANSRNANLIVAFHPLIFPAITAITDRTRTGFLLREVIRSNIALYIQHTAFDTHPEFGTSRLMAQALGLETIETLSPLSRPDLPPHTGMGARGRWTEPKDRDRIFELVSKTLGTQVIRYNRGGPATVETVAVLGGAGMDFYPAALQSGAGAFITADVRYHDFHRADHDNILLIDAGHAETEKFVMHGMVTAARKALELQRSAS